MKRYEIPKSATEEAARIANSTPLDAYAQEIGRLCIYWSQVELVVTILLKELASATDILDQAALLGGMDLRGKLKALRVIGYRYRPDDNWYDILDETLKLIDGRLRQERNRVIHDLWAVDGTNVLRIQYSPTVRKIQSRTREASVLESRKTTAADIRQIYVDILACGIQLKKLHDAFGARRAAPIQR